MEVVTVKVNAGEEIKEAILSYVVEHHIREALVIGAIGSAIDLCVTTPVSYELPLTTVEVFHKVSCEVVGMSGEILSWEKVDPKLKSLYPDKESPLFIHLHIAAASAGGAVFGGGLRSGKALREVNVFLLPQ